MNKWWFKPYVSASIGRKNNLRQASEQDVLKGGEIHRHTFVTNVDGKLLTGQLTQGVKTNSIDFSDVSLTNLGGEIYEHAP